MSIGDGAGMVTILTELEDGRAGLLHRTALSGELDLPVYVGLKGTA